MPIGNLRNQDITYWTQSGLGRDGYPSFNSPTTVRGRWEDRVVLVQQEGGGELLSSNSRVYLAVKLSQGDHVYLGTSVSASPISAARKVVRVVEIPSVDGTRSEKVHYLD